MKRLTLLLLVFWATTCLGQTPANDALFGTPNLQNESARIELATNSDARWSLSALTFDWNNGPPGEVDYQDHTFGFGFNVNKNGTKAIPGLVSFTFSNETKYRNGVAGEPGAFMSEHHFNWASPDDSIKIRPFGFTVQYDTGNVDWSYHGEIRLFRHASNGGAMRGILYDDGRMDFAMAPNPVISFPNNVRSLCWRTASGINSLCPLTVDNQNRTRLGVGGGSDVYVDSNWIDVNNISLGGVISSRTSPATKLQMTGFYTWIFSDDVQVAAFSKYQVNLYKPLVVDIAQIGLLKIKDGEVLFSVSIGDDNSCGNGYRCLRVNN